MNELFKMVDKTSEFDPQDAKNAMAMGILAYLGPLALIPYFAEKDSAWARFHAIQGLNILIVAAAVNIVCSILSLIFAFIPYIGGIIITLLSIISWVVSVGVGVLAIIGIVHAATGKAAELPVIKAIKIVKK